MVAGNKNMMKVRKNVLTAFVSVALDSSKGTSYDGNEPQK